MPYRAPSRTTTAFHPPMDAATFRDLLLFEERLKSNASILKRRKRRYQCACSARALVQVNSLHLVVFLAQLLIIISFLAAEVFLQMDLLSIPYASLLRTILPDIYARPEHPRPPPRLHPAFASGLLFVSATTLVLFFASGVYDEKIGYANR
jgi:hypothetical protein